MAGIGKPQSPASGPQPGTMETQAPGAAGPDSYGLYAMKPVPWLPQVKVGAGRTVAFFVHVSDIVGRYYS